MRPLCVSSAVRKRIAGVAPPAMGRLMQYEWPGNVRELQNVLERAIVLTSGRVIERVDVPEPGGVVRVEGKHSSPTLPLREWLNEQEKQYLVHQLEACGGKISLAARSCGVDVKTLYRKMRQHGLNKRTFRRREAEVVISATDPAVESSPPTALRPHNS